MTDESSTKKRVPISQIKAGMYVVSLDRSWLQTPFVFHRKLIKGEDDIELLRRRGIREVVIDTARGIDVDPELPVDSIKESAVPGDSPSEPVITTRPPRLPTAAETAFQPLIKELQVARTIHEEALTAAQSIFDGARGGAPVNAQTAERVVTGLLSSIGRSPEANLLLLQMRRFQRDLFAHAVNVCVLSLVVGTLEDFAIDSDSLGLGALLHDVGETRIPRNLIRKRDGFTDSEIRLVEQHPRLGALLVQQSEEIPPIAQRIILEHHERIDGSGYPNRIRGKDISLQSQVVAITDLYDDMLSGRNQAVLQPTEVLRQLFVQSNAGALDRGVVERIIRCLGVYPVGSLVELNTGEQGIVVAANRADTLKPTVRIVTSRSGLVQSNGPIISLADARPDEPERRIVGALDPGRERIDPMTFLKLAPTHLGSM